MAKICVFIASSKPSDLQLKSDIQYVATQIAGSGHELVMGGMSSGGMKLFGRTFIKAGGRATIIYPVEYAAFENSFHHPRLTHVRTANLHRRLECMISMADAFITFPGGMGTIHEIAQVIADNQACTYHTGTTRKVKPMIIYNYGGFFDQLFAMYQTAHASGYIKPEHLSLLQESNERNILPALQELLHQQPEALTA